MLFYSEESREWQTYMVMAVDQESGEYTVSPTDFSRPNDPMPDPDDRNQDPELWVGVPFDSLKLKPLFPFEQLQIMNFSQISQTRSMQMQGGMINDGASDSQVDLVDKNEVVLRLENQELNGDQNGFNDQPDSLD